MREHFSTLVSDWDQLGPPLRPSPDDVAVVQAAIDAACPRVGLVLGVTPELVGCRWPGEVLAVDHSDVMIRRLRPPVAICADWLAMPLRTGSVDLAVGDGCLVAFDSPTRRRFFEEVRRVLAPGGRLVLRVFVRPDTTERVDDVAADLAAGRVPSVHALKLRLIAALDDGGTDLAEVWRAWSRLPRPPAGPGWTDREVASLVSYRDRAVRYHLPTVAAITQELTEAFGRPTLTWGAYPGADRCPSFVSG